MHGALPSAPGRGVSNRVAIGVAEVADVRRPRLTVIAAIDNLVKGAAGQAIQNMNVMLGLPKRRAWRAERAASSRSAATSSTA